MTNYFEGLKRNTDSGGPDGKVARWLHVISELENQKTFTEEDLRQALKMPDSATEVLNKLAEYGYTATLLRR